MFDGTRLNVVASSYSFILFKMQNRHLCIDCSKKMRSRNKKKEGLLYAIIIRAGGGRIRGCLIATWLLPCHLENVKVEILCFKTTIKKHISEVKSYLRRLYTKACTRRAQLSKANAPINEEILKIPNIILKAQQFSKVVIVFSHFNVDFICHF